MKILGAGLAGLIAGALNENAELYEPFNQSNTHQALLRFRSPDIGEAVGIPFREVSAYKGIWYKDQAVPLSPKLMVDYSKKVSDRISHRSIRHLDTETRWMAPEGFQDMLREICQDRIVYNQDKQALYSHIYEPTNEPMISTLPMDVLAKVIDAEHKLAYELEIIKSVKPIYITRFRVDNCDAFMTNYFPDPTLAVYRASISGDTLIIESTKPIYDSDMNNETVLASFGLWETELELLMSDYEQKNGKMSLIDEGARKRFILYATMEHGIYSLGRFAIWKDILLDDVYHDVLRIKQFINRDKYEHYRDFT